MSELDDQWEAARLAILTRIKDNADAGMTGASLKDLAEAFAWLTSVAQPH